MTFPALHVGGPGNQCVIIPKTDGFTVPAGHVLTDTRDCAFHVEFLADMNIGNEVTRDPAEELHHVRGDHNIDFPLGSPMPAAHEPFWPAVLRGPLRRIGMS